LRIEGTRKTKVGELETEGNWKGSAHAGGLKKKAVLAWGIPLAQVGEGLSRGCKRHGDGARKKRGGKKNGRDPRRTDKGRGNSRIAEKCEKENQVSCVGPNSPAQRGKWGATSIKNRMSKN